MDKIRMWFIAILFLSGLGITLYPFVSNLIAQSNASRAIDSYNEIVAQMDEEEIDAAKAAIQKYNEQLNNAFVSGQEMEEGISYVDMMDIGESIGFITIPKIDVDLPIYNGTGEDVLQKGVGHLENSSYPVGGMGTHSVLTGHRGLPNAVLFTDLNKLEEGDYFYLHVLDEVLAYRVDQIKVVLPEETGDLKIEKDKDYCTLVTCTPYAVNTHRLLVRGSRTEYIPEEESRQELEYVDVSSGTLVKRLVDARAWLAVALLGMVIVESMFFVLIVSTRAKIRRRKRAGLRRQKESQKGWE
ncbi:MAG: class C sortase [Lachnospiraceae bacterium]|nr:class C sortase [Lachnospiraceae bacterium]